MYIPNSCHLSKVTSLKLAKGAYNYVILDINTIKNYDHKVNRRVGALYAYHNNASFLKSRGKFETRKRATLRKKTRQVGNGIDGVAIMTLIVSLFLPVSCSKKCFQNGNKLQ